MLAIKSNQIAKKIEKKEKKMKNKRVMNTAEIRNNKQ